MAAETIGVIGAGNMGLAIIKGLIASEVYPESAIYIYDIDAHREEIALKEGVTVTHSIEKMAETVDVVVVAVKPANVEEALLQLKGVQKKTPVISICAGITTKAIEAVLHEHPVVRVMPNTPCMIGEGASAVARGAYATVEHVRKAVEIMSALGYSVEVPESLMDAVTGLSASGPAYVAIMIDALSEGGVKMGIPRKIALKLAAQTVSGTARMIMEKGMEPSSLRDMVTSPGGTTAEGISALERNAFRWALIDAVESAAIKARELGK
jgi:pyrroline-5-carboxylate reductase